MSEYKQSLKYSMERLAEDPRVIFLGYGVRTGGRALGTLKDIPDSQLLEMPVAEGLMIGAALGLSLAGRLPVVFIERMDFLMNAMDALVNHLDKLEAISRGEFHPSVLVRCVVGNRSKPLFTGETHTQDFTAALELMLKMPVVRLTGLGSIRDTFDKRNFMQREGLPPGNLLTVEYKDLH